MERGGASGAYGGTTEVRSGFRYGNLQERDQLKVLDIDVKILLK
jgi:hypothetical protein